MKAKKKSKASSKKSTAKKTNRTSAARRSKPKHPKKQELMTRLERYLKNGGWNIIPERMEKVIKATGKAKTSIRNAYLFGEGDTDFWFSVEELIGPLNCKQQFQLWDSWPSLKKEYDKIPSELKSIHRNLNKLGNDDTIRLDQLIKALITASNLLEKSKK